MLFGCLSRMRGNLHVRFLGEGVAARLPPYPPRDAGSIPVTRSRSIGSVFRPPPSQNPLYAHRIQDMPNLAAHLPTLYLEECHLPVNPWLHRKSSHKSYTSRFSCFCLHQFFGSIPITAIRRLPSSRSLLRYTGRDDGNLG